MKTALFFLLLYGITGVTTAQQIDTTYYDRNFKGVKYRALAQYVRYDFSFNDPNFTDRARIYLINDQLYCEGTPLSYDKYDNDKSLWTGEFIRFYTSGKKEMECTFDESGKIHGKKTTWTTKGELLAEELFSHGALHGLSYTFAADNPDLCYITLFDKGKPVNDESVLRYRSGREVRVNYYSREIVQTTPSEDDCQFLVTDGFSSWYYNMNGIFISLGFAKTRQYGKYYQCFLEFSNNTKDPIEINPSKISGHYIKEEKTKEIELMPADKYLKKIARVQAFSQVTAGIASGLSTYNAGYSTSTTSMTAVGTGGWASGTAVTNTFNPYERQAILNQEQKKLDAQAQQDQQVKDAIDGSILKRTTVFSGETIFKSFYIKYLSAESLVIRITISGTTYTFNMKN